MENRNCVGHFPNGNHEFSVSVLYNWPQAQCALNANGRWINLGWLMRRRVRLFVIPNWCPMYPTIKQPRGVCWSRPDIHVNCMIIIPHVLETCPKMTICWKKKIICALPSGTETLQLHTQNGCQYYRTCSIAMRESLSNRIQQNSEHDPVKLIHNLSKSPANR
jgi:hypothetical protein